MSSPSQLLHHPLSHHNQQTSHTMATPKDPIEDIFHQVDSKLNDRFPGSLQTTGPWPNHGNGALLRIQSRNKLASTYCCAAQEMCFYLGVLHFPSYCCHPSFHSLHLGCFLISLNFLYFSLCARLLPGLPTFFPPFFFFV